MAQIAGYQLIKLKNKVTVEEDCCICLDNIEVKNIYTTKCCKQKLHINCYIEWLIICFDKYNFSKCPICRNILDMSIIKKEISIKDLIEFKILNPNYTYKIYKFLDTYFTEEYELPSFIEPLINQIGETQEINLDLESQTLHQNEITSQKIQKLIGLIMIITFILSFIAIYIVSLIPH